MRVTPEPDSPDGPTADRGVFGNLPSERPGVRSPRRGGEKDAPAAKARQAKAAAPRKPPPPKSPPRVERSEPKPSAVPPDEASASRKGIEEAAWAGVTVAAEAATLGVRLFSRALEAVRERR